MSVNTWPLINPFNWGYNGTIKHVTNDEGTVKLQLKNGEEPLQFEEFLNKYVPELKNDAKFKLNPALFTGILQTMYLGSADYSREFQVFYGREIVKFSDGGVCTVDYVMKDWENEYKLNETTKKFDVEKFKQDEADTHAEGWPRLQPRTRYLRDNELQEVHSDDRPLVLVLHGLAGGSHEPVIRSLTQQLSRIGGGKFQVAVLNSRGCARSKITTRSLFTAFHTGDTREFLQRVRNHHPNKKIYAVGFSFGATMLANYLGEEGENTPLSAACTLSNPWDMVMSSVKTSNDWWSKNLFSANITQFLVRLVKVNMGELEVPEGTEPEHPPTVKNPSYYNFTKSNLQKAFKFKTIADFDSTYTAPCLGFKSAMDYYKSASSINRLPNIKIPLLSINARDDPVVGPEGVPFDLMKQNPHVVHCETDIGGHLAYLDLEWKPWVTKEIAQYFNVFDDHVE